MSDLLGAWSLGGAPVATLLDQRVWQTMKVALTAGQQTRAEHRDERLWLCTRESTLRVDRRTLVAAEGFIIPGGLDDVLADPSKTAEGHYVLVRYDRTQQSLQLVRGLSGGERLYYAQLGPLLLFSCSIRPLLVHPELARTVERSVVDEVLLCGLTMFGSKTLHRGVHELLAGHQLAASDHVAEQRCHGVATLCAPTGDARVLARTFRERLAEAVAAAAGPSRPVPVALSGGIDSSAIAAAAVEAFGADNVQAITYEFSDPSHDTELAYAQLVARRLGIGRHHVFQLSLPRYLDAIPEMIWRSESLVHWPKAFMLLVAREVASLGFDRYLTGFGIGSHMAYLSELATALQTVSNPRWVLFHWRTSRFSKKRWPDRVARLHPALESPHPRLYYQLVRQLYAAGYLADERQMFPSQLAPLLQRLDPLDSVVPELTQLPLELRLQRQAFAHLISCIDVTRSEKASRELGVYRISPAHFARCLPYAYYPYKPRPRLYSKARALRPGKHLLQLAYRNMLPDEVLFRVKSWADAVASDDWLRRGRQLMLSVLPFFPGDMQRYGNDYPAAIRYWEGHSILASSLAFRLWERMFIDLSPSEQLDEERATPSWQTLWRSLHAKAKPVPAGAMAKTSPTSHVAGVA